MKKQLMSEVRQLQKLAGLLKENWHLDEEKDDLDLKSRMQIAQKTKDEIDSYLDSLGCKRISNEEAPSTKQNVPNRLTSINTYTDSIKTEPNHWNDSSDDANFDNQNHEGRIVSYNLRIYAPSENFDYKKISSIIRSAEKEAKSKGAAAFAKLSRSYKDVMVQFTISNWRK
jgi:hypothetical protein